MNSFTRQKILLESWQILKENPVFIIGFFLFIFLISIAPNFLINGFSPEKEVVNDTPVTYQILIFILQIIISFVLIRVLLLLVDKKPLNKENILPTSQMFYNFTIGTIIYDIGLILIVMLMQRMGAAGIIAFLLFIFIILKFQFVNYIIIDKNTTALTAFKISNEITKNELTEIFLLLMTLLFINIIGAIFFGIGLLLTMPVSVIAIVLLYRELIKKVSFESEG